MKEEPGSAGHAENRRLAAIMFTDIVGFSRQMGSNEARMLRLLEVHNQIIQQTVAEHHGIVIKTVGDAFLVDFPSVVHAVQCAQQIQAQFRAHNAEREATEQIHVRIGIHSGDIVQRDGDVFGDGVNIASRLQTLAEPDTTCISDVVYRDVVKKLDLGTVVSLGRPKLKNIAERFQVYALLPETPNGFWQKLQVQRLKLSRRVRPVMFVLVFVSVALVAGTIAVRYLSFLTPSTQHVPRTTQESLPLPDKPSIVVLPFVNMSDDPKQEYFSDGITEDITTDLSRISSLFVIARNSAFTYKGKAVKVQEVSRELGVRYVLEGSVRKAGDQVRVTTQLIDATTGGHLWSERYDRPFSDIFALQDEIRQKIVLALKVKLTPEEQERFQHAPTNNLEAYDYYLRSLEFGVPLTKETNAQARQLCERALELDPQYAGAYARLSLTYWVEWFWYGGQDQTLERATELAQKAVALDESLPVAHLMLGWVYLMKKQHGQAQTEMERAITLNPNSAFGYEGLSFVLHSSGKSQEAIAVAAQAVRLNPQSLNALNALGQTYVSAGQYEEAIAIFKKILARNPDYWAAHWGLAFIYSESGKEEEAKAEGTEILRITPNFSIERWKQRVFLKDPAEIERRAAALRKAGLK
jgi:adenylate cyclase